MALRALGALALASFDSAFVAWPDRQRIRARAAEQIDELIAEAVASGVST